MTVIKFANSHQKAVNTLSELYEQRMLFLMAEMFKEGKRSIVGDTGLRVNDAENGFVSDKYEEQDLLDLIAITSFRSLRFVIMAVEKCDEKRANEMLFVFFERHMDPTDILAKISSFIEKEAKQ